MWLQEMAEFWAALKKTKKKYSYTNKYFLCEVNLFQFYRNRNVIGSIDLQHSIIQ